ncbi:MAG TPA: hypothetical protein VJ783_02235 [Pirellulales bacterium]|nr:hypothetical protein [Pirellulales bacterium]
MTNATFDILAGRLTLDVSGFLGGLQTAGQAVERFVSNLSGFAASIKQGTAAVNGLSTAVGRTFQQAKIQLEEFTTDSRFQNWFGMGGNLGRQGQPRMNAFGMPQLAAMNGPLAFLQRLAETVGPSAGIGAAIGGTQSVQNLLDQHQQAGDALGSLDLQIANVQARLAQSRFNLSQLSNESMAGGGLGGFPGVDNSAYALTLDSPLTREIKSLTATLYQLLAQRRRLAATAGRQPPKLAEGGVVDQPTLAVVGDAGPEAVIPLSRLQQMFGNPANIFRWNQNGMMGQRLTQGGLANFDAAFERASQSLTFALDHGIAGAQSILDRWSSVQQAAENTLDFMYQHRRINLQPAGGTGGRYDRFATSGSVLGQLLHPAAAFAPQIAVHLHGVDVTNPANGQVIARAVYDHLVDETKRRGLDGLGRDPVRSLAQSRRGPLTPAGLAQ